MKNLDRIREMNDEELIKYLKSLSNKKATNCIKCGTLVTKKSIIIHDKHTISNRKLCNLCDNCYSELLDYLGVADIEWE